MCIAVIVFFRRDEAGHPSLEHAHRPTRCAFVGSASGEYLLMSRFGLLAGTVAEGVDPSQQAWGLNLTGWILITAPFVLFVFGTIWGSIRQDKENVDAVADLVS